MKRITLEEIGKKSLTFHIPKTVIIDGREMNATLKVEYELDFEAGIRYGGTCIVYHAYKIVEFAGTFLKHKVILKEFYPELEKDEILIMRREDGSLEIPEEVKNQEIYRVKLERFKQSFGTFVGLHNEKKTNNFVVDADDLIEANGTWYLAADYNEACTLSEYMEKQPNLYEFCLVMKHVAKAVSKLHEAGYLHLDLTPRNLMVFEDGSVRLLDTDSFVKKDALQSKRPELSLSIGYAAPELCMLRRYLIFAGMGEVNDIYSGEKIVYQCLARNGERSDIYSIGAILYRYLCGKRLGERGCKESLAEKIEEKYALSQTDIVKCPQNAVRMLEEFLSIALSEEMACRYETMKEVTEVLETVLPLVEPKRIQILDNFRKNADGVYGREEKLRELETAFTEQGQQGKHRLVLICGIGGIGKSTLARAYAQKHLEQYEVIAEVSEESAEGVVKSIGLVNYDGNVLGERLKLLQTLLQEKKCLLIVHDYNQREDESFALFKELPCDVILTSWADWKESSICCIPLKSDDLTETAAANIFLEIYLKNAQTASEELKLMLEEENQSLNTLLKQVEYHPLTIKLLAKQMSYQADKAQTPTQMLEELVQFGILENTDVKFQNQKDGAGVEFGNVFFHLEKIYGSALQKGSLTEDELKVLRYMTLISGENGVCVRRFEKWTNMEEAAWLENPLLSRRKRIDVGKVLTSLYKKGWIEYKPQETDELWLELRRHADWLELFQAEDKEFWENLLNEEKGEKKETKRYRDTWLEKGFVEAKGVYHMPMCISQVLHCQEQMKSTVGNSHYPISVLGECKIYLEYFKRYSTVKYVLEYVERLCRYIQEEQRESYAIFLVECSLIKIQWEFSKIQKEKAIEMLEMATNMRLSLAGGSGREFYVAYKALAEGYFYYGQYEKAIEYSEKAMQFEEYASNWSYIGRKQLYNLLIDSYLEIGNYKDAEENIQKFDQMKQGDCGNRVMTKIDWAELHERLGRIEVLKGNDFRSAEYWEQAREEYIEEDSFQLQYYQRIADIEYALATVYWKIGWKSRAIVCLESSLQFYNQGNEQTDSIKKLLEKYQWEFGGQKDDVRRLKDWYCEQLRVRPQKEYARIRKRLEELEPFLSWWEKKRLRCYLKHYKQL